MEESCSLFYRAFHPSICQNGSPKDEKLIPCCYKLYSSLVPTFIRIGNNVTSLLPQLLFILSGNINAKEGNSYDLATTHSTFLKLKH